MPCFKNCEARQGNNVWQDVDNVLGRIASHAHSLQQQCDIEMERIDAALAEASVVLHIYSQALEIPCILYAVRNFSCG